MPAESARTYRPFSYRGANFRIGGAGYELICSELVRLRVELEAYVAGDAAFRESLVPVAAAVDAPRSARWMAAAAAKVGVGPMAAVAATLAAMACQAAREAGCESAVVENGGDLFAYGPGPLTVGLYAGASPLSDKLALRVVPGASGLAVCSSSSRMGHSLSLGDCDLATVVSPDAALADAAATAAANLVKTVDDVDAALERIAAIEGVTGVIIIQGDRIGLSGSPGELLANRDAALRTKVTRDASLGDGI